MRFPSPLLALLSTLAFPVLSLADHPWPQFRGPDGNGIASAESLPTRWSETENVTWKTPLPGRGWSSPVITEQGKIWVTTALEHFPESEEEKERILAEAGLPANHFSSRQVATSIKLQALELDWETGKLERTIDLFDIVAPDPIHAQNSYASPTPLLEGDRLYCHFGTFGTICLDLKSGKEVWQRRIPLVHAVGPGSSPYLIGDLLILICDGVDAQYVTALDKHTGEPVWRTDRPEMRAEDGDQRKSYCTPISLTDKRGRTQLVCMGSQWLVSYDPETGKEIWRLDHGNGFSVVPRPVYDSARGLILFATGFGKPQLWAVRPEGDGDISESDLVVWKEPSRMPARPSPVLVGEDVFVIHDGGVATYLDAATGTVHWSDRVGGNFSSSPLLADGRIYIGSHEGKISVITPARQSMQIVSENQLDGGVYASPAALDGALLIRTDQALYRIGE